MSVRRYFGGSSREAMRQVRANLGEDALILSNRQMEEGVEIIAMAGTDNEAMTDPLPTAVEADRPSANGAGPARIPNGQEALLAAQERLVREVQEMRAALNLSPPGPPRDAGPDAGMAAEIRRRIIGAGLGGGIAGEVEAATPADLKAGSAANTWLARQLVSRLTVPTDADSDFYRGGTLALVGPTGVGKTTTAAKLAARYVMQYGGEGVALVSADHYRVGAREQLRVYADLLGVEVHTLDPKDSLAALPPHLTYKSLVIIDTAGMGQRDQRLVEQMSQLADSQRRVRSVLVVNAAADADNLDDTVAAYRGAARTAGTDIRDAIVTKLDEAPRLGPALAAVMRHGLTLNFVSHGQRVPEDIAPARAEDLVAEALMVPPSEAPGTDPERPRHPLDRSLTLQSVWSVLCRQFPAMRALEQAWSGECPAAVSLPAAEAAVLARSREWVQNALALDDRGRIQVLPVTDGEAPLPVGPGSRCGLLLAAVPDSHTWLSLLENHVDWMASVTHNTRVRHRGELVPMASLRPLAEPVDGRRVELRGRQLQLRLRKLPVFLTASGRRRRCSGYLHAWIGELRHFDTGVVWRRRYWLAPAELSEDTCTELLLHQLTADTFFRLRARAMDDLADRLPARRRQPGELALLAHSLAALACRLERDDSDWALDARAQLLALDGRARRRSGEALLEAVVELFSQRGALRRLALALPAGSA